MPPLLPEAVHALGGVVGANVLGALTRGGGAVLRTLMGAAGGAGFAWALERIAPGAFDSLIHFAPGAAGVQLGHLFIGALGGGALGLLVGALIAPRA